MTTQPPQTPDEPGAAVAGRDPLEIAQDVVDDVAGELDPAELAALEALDQPRRVLFVHAHPDDETIGTGATMARYAEAGASVVLLTLTRGELGRSSPPTWPTWTRRAWPSTASTSSPPPWRRWAWRTTAS